MNPKMNQDAWDAMVAWRSYADNRFGGYTLSCRTDVREAARVAFVTEFLICRGWRQLPGTQEWV